MSGNSENSGWQIGLPLAICAGLAAGLLIGAKMAGMSDAGTADGKLQEVLDVIRENYVDETPVDSLAESVVTQILEKLDPHSVYIPVADIEAANEDLRGNYEGIGIEFNIYRDTLTVVTALSGGPSEEAGLRPGDRIIKVDGKLIAGTGLKNPEVFKLLKGPRGTKVELAILRRKEARNYTITRDKIPQFSVDAHYMVDAVTGYIKISRFSSTTFDEYMDAFQALKGKGMKRLILDLQGNPGGYMNEAISLADEFLPEGKKIVFTKGNNSDFNQSADATSTGAFEEGELIVLVNEGSASASEIVAGALQDNDRALLVGRRTYGKGLVQNPFTLSDGSELRLTISRYYTPSGRSIQRPYGDEFAYAEDLDNRFRNGELFHSDSVRFNDSLRYTTLAGRTVYGGGGIMPDFFVPLDTASGNGYLNELYNVSAIQEYTLDYTDQNKSELESIGLDQFISRFQVNEEMLNALMATGERAGLKADRKALNREKELFQMHVKAQIARKLWGSSAFFQVFNTTNEAYQQALGLFGQVSALLKPKS